MPNIIINNYCNQKCPYCFAEAFMEEKTKIDISIPQLQHILEWISQTGCDRIGIIGGEPLLHPQFKFILNEIKLFCRSRNIPIILFTNGVYLRKYASYLSGISMLINVNHPDIVGLQWNDLLESLKIVSLDQDIRAELGINLYMDCIDYSFIKKPLEIMHLDRIRVSVCAPNTMHRYLNKNEYYLAMKEIFLSFVKYISSLNIKVWLDCNKIPHCYFTDNEITWLKEWVIGYKAVCSHAELGRIDITPNMQGTACFGAYDIVDLSKFKTLKDAERYIYANKILPKMVNNNFGKCFSCNDHKLLQCQGGCLAFSSNS